MHLPWTTVHSAWCASHQPDIICGNSWGVQTNLSFPRAIFGKAVPHLSAAACPIHPQHSRPAAAVVRAGALTFLAYKLHLLNCLEDHPPRMALQRLAALVPPPADLAEAADGMVSVALLKPQGAWA